MCSQCSFQVVLRSLRFKQAKHLHGTKQELLLQHRSSRRSYVTAAIPQTYDPPPIEIPKYKRRTPAHSPTQHLETWRPPPPPPLPTQVLEILQDNPFTSSDGIAKLLHSLASHPHAFSHVHEIVAPTIKGLLSVRHYAGARAVIERVLDGFLDRDKFRPVGKKELHTLIDAILGTDDFRRPTEFELHSLPAIRSMLHLLLQYLVNFPEKFCILPVIVKTLVCVPEYLDLQSMPLFLHLYHEVINNYPAGGALGSNVPTMHNIMRVYALQGDSETAERWMQAILAAQEAKKQEQPKASKSTEISKSDSFDLDRKAPSSKPFNRASSVLHLSTTYLSSLAQPKEVGLKISSIDSGDAMSLFQDLWDYSKHQHAPLENPVPDNLANMTVHAWSAIIHAAALDVNGIPSSRLLAALRSLQDSGV